MALPVVGWKPRVFSRTPEGSFPTENNPRSRGWKFRVSEISGLVVVVVVGNTDITDYQ